MWIYLILKPRQHKTCCFWSFQTAWDCPSGYWKDIWTCNIAGPARGDIEMFHALPHQSTACCKDRTTVFCACQASHILGSVSRPEVVHPDTRKPWHTLPRILFLGGQRARSANHKPSLQTELLTASENFSESERKRLRGKINLTEELSAVKSLAQSSHK
jgi:hypothetical protein